MLSQGDLSYHIISRMPALEAGASRILILRPKLQWGLPMASLPTVKMIADHSFDGLFCSLGETGSSNRSTAETAWERGIMRHC